MKKIVAFSGSNSKNSINQQVINSVGAMLSNIEVINVNDFVVPMYSVDLEKDNGIPKGIKDILQKIITADSIIISTPEHNGLMPAFFKNILDWLSRTGIKYLENKKVLVMSVSPGRGGGIKGAESVARIIGYAGAKDIIMYSFPNFNDNFDAKTNSITNSIIKAKLNTIVEELS